MAGFFCLAMVPLTGHLQVGEVFDVATKQRKQRRRRLKDVQVDEISIVDSPAVPEATWIIAKRDKSAESEDGVSKSDTKPVTDDTQAATDGGSETPSGGAEAVAKDGSQDGGTEAATGKDALPAGGENEPVQKNRKAVGEAFASAIASLRAVAGEMEEEALQQLAGLISYTRWAFNDVPQVIREMNKCDSELGVDATCESFAKSIAKELAKMLEPAASDGDGESDPEPVEKASTHTEPTEPAEHNEPPTEPEPSLLEKAAVLWKERCQQREAEKAAKSQAAVFESTNRLAAALEKVTERATKLGEKLDQTLGE